MGGQQGTRKRNFVPIKTPTTTTPQNQPPPASTPPPAKQQPVESFISGMGNIVDPFFPQTAHAELVGGNQVPNVGGSPSTRHPGSKNVRGNKNQAKIARAKEALQLAKQKHQQQAIIGKQARDRHDDQLARVEQALSEQKGTFFEQGIAKGISGMGGIGSIEPTFFEQQIDGLAQGVSENIARPKEDKLKRGYQKKGFQGTRKGDLQKRHIPEFQHPMMNPFLPTAHATSVPKPPPKLEPIEQFNISPMSYHWVSPTNPMDEYRQDLNQHIAETVSKGPQLRKRELQWVKGQKALTREPQPVSVRYAQEPVENKVQERGFRQQKAEASRVDFALGIKDTEYADGYLTGYTDEPLPHEIKRQLKNIQISHAGRKQQKAGANYDNTFFEDIRGIPSTFMMYRGTNHERKGTIREWEKLTPAQQQAEKDWETKSGGTSPVSGPTYYNWANPWG